MTSVLPLFAIAIASEFVAADFRRALLALNLRSAAISHCVPRFLCLTSLLNL
jgi:hypothetical protein